MAQKASPVWLLLPINGKSQKWGLEPDGSPPNLMLLINTHFLHFMLKCPYLNNLITCLRD